MTNLLPPKLYFRIGEVAGLVGVEPHVLRYWEREFRSIRPTKSAKGQRVYSRKDVEALLVVKDLLYAQGFTIAGAKKKLSRGGDGQAAPAAPASSAEMAPSAPHVPHASHASSTPLASAELHADGRAASAFSVDGAHQELSRPALAPHAPRMREEHHAPPRAEARGIERTSPPPNGASHGDKNEELLALRAEVEAFLRELGG